MSESIFPHNTEYDEQLDLMLRLAREAQWFVDEAIKVAEVNMKYATKHDGTRVTSTDHAINEYVIERVEMEFPGVKIIGEEKSGGVVDADEAFVVDPIDGTAAFTWGVPTSMFSIGYTVHGETKAAVLHDPFKRETIGAVKGEGVALRNNRRVTNFRADEYPIHVSEEALLGSSVAICGYRAFKEHDPYKLSAVIMNEGNGSRIVDTGSFCYDSMLVARGHWTAVIGGFDTCHDGAAVSLIVAEAGGKVTDLDGNDQRYDRPMNGIVVSNGVVHDEILEKIAECKK